MDDSREVLIPMPFFWPYGGSSVFLCGSFNRWSEVVAMTPVEGCPTVFQAICSIPPGHHQYKFFVDGVWRHDEHQPYAASEYGIVNTISVTAEPNVKPNSPTPQLPTIPTMDLDNEVIAQFVHRGDQSLPDAASRIPDADLAVSRHRVSAFLATHTAYELLPESGKVIALDIELPVKQAFHILHEQGIPTAPLWDFRRGQFVGVISVVDFILILRELGNRGPSLTEEELETHSIAAWKEGKAYLNRQLDGHGRAILRPLVHFDGIVAEEGRGALTQRVDAISRYKRLLYVLRTPCSKNTVDEPDRKLEVYLGWFLVLFAQVLYLALSPSFIDEIPTKQNLESEKFLFRLPLACHAAHDSNLVNDIMRGEIWLVGTIEAGPYDSLKEICLRILQNNVATIPILHSSSEDSSFPQLLLMASLSGILKCLCRYFRHCSSSLPVLQLPIYAIPIGTWVPKIGESNRRPLAMLRPSDSLSSALNLLIAAQVSSLPIVDNNDSLLDIYSRSDITALAKDKAYTHMNLNEMTIHQALALGQDSYSPYEPRNQRCQMCLPSDSLHKVMERLANPGTRRLIIVEAGSKRIEGIVTLGDVFKFLLG